MQQNEADDGTYDDDMARNENTDNAIVHQQTLHTSIIMDRRRQSDAHTSILPLTHNTSLSPIH